MYVSVENSFNSRTVEKRGFSTFKRERTCTEVYCWLNSPSQSDVMFHLKAKQQSLTEGTLVKDDMKNSWACKINQ